MNDEFLDYLHTLITDLHDDDVLLASLIYAIESKYNKMIDERGLMRQKQERNDMLNKQFNKIFGDNFKI